MKRKRFPLSLCLALSLTLCACSGSAPEPVPSPSTPPASEPPVEALRVERTPTEVTAVAPGDTITLDFAQLVLGDVEGGAKMTEGIISYVACRENTAFFWLNAGLTNTSDQPLNLFYMNARLIFDDTDSYEGSVRRFSEGLMAPQEESSIYLYAVVPPAQLEDWETVTVQFGFNQDFAQYDYPANGYEERLDYYDYFYEVTYPNPAAEAG